MPLVHSEMIEETSTLLLWKLTETETELRNNLGHGYNAEELQSISHPQKVREWLASRLLIKTLAEQFGIAYIGTHKDEHGKAFLIDNDSHISITHTFEYVAVAINPYAAVGIDMEKSDEKLAENFQKIPFAPRICACGRPAPSTQHVLVRQRGFVQAIRQKEDQLQGCYLYRTF
jgi:4'-phosphopantetheinyl transferase